MIFITGDTHGPNPIGLHSVDGFGKRMNKEYFPEQKEMTRDDFVIICGDFGGVWNYDSRYDITGSTFKDKICLDYGESKEEKYWLDWLSKKNFTLLFCDGNHENFDRLYRAYPEVDFHGGKAHQLRENVFHLIRGYIFDLCGLSFFTFGGARSHDISGGILRPYEYSTEKDYKAAYNSYKQFKHNSDSLSALEVRQLAAEHSLQLDLARSESEAKDHVCIVDESSMIDDTPSVMLTPMVSSVHA